MNSAKNVRVSCGQLNSLGWTENPVLVGRDRPCVPSGE